MDLSKYLTNIIGVALTAAAVVTLVMLVWGGLNWALAGGEEKKIEAAKDRISGAIIGLAVVAISWAIFLLLDTFFGLNVVK